MQNENLNKTNPESVKSAGAGDRSPVYESEITQPEKLFFGVDSACSASERLQNNLTQFQWVTINKKLPCFWARNLIGKDCLTKEEILFIHANSCKVAVKYPFAQFMTSGRHGVNTAREAAEAAKMLDIPKQTAIFLEIDEKQSTTEFLKGYAEGLISEGFTPGFKANTDSKYDFDRRFSRGMQTNPGLFGRCLIWATAPGLKQFDRITDSHIIHPINWAPFAPSGTTRKQIAVWQYGKNCHPINDNKSDTERTFNVNLIRNESVLTEKMF
ncbi:MAG: glycoside hydrolase domain-containing protein [Acutalibacteraceae bacterium]